MRTMFVGGFGAAGHSYWMGQVVPVVPVSRAPAPVQAQATAQAQMQAQGQPSPAPSTVVEQPYTIPVINQQVPGTILGLPAKTVVIGGAVILGVVVLTQVL